MKDNLIFSLDIGTRTIIGIVGEYIEDDKFRVLAHAIKEHSKRNMYDGQIHDIEGVTRIVKEIVKELEGKTGEELKVVSIAAAGRALKTFRIRNERSVDKSREVSRHDVEALELEAVQRAQEEINKLENGNLRYYSIGYSIVDYYLDDSRMERLEGHRGDEIAVDLLATFLPQIVIESLYTVMAKSGLEVGSITLEPIAAINIAIKKELRLLNLALVDLGAGTSDIAITKDGQIISYAMTSTAGDEITERLAKEYLLDFNSSERLKIGLSKKDQHEFTDVVGIAHSLTRKEIVDSIIDVVEKIASEIKDRIIEFNGKAPNAVFLIGGSSQMPMLKEMIADKLELPRDRVAIRDLSILDTVLGLEGLGGPDMITPVGIALEATEEKYRNFIRVKFNGEEVRIFNTDDIKISDVLVLTGYDPKNLLPSRSPDFVYYINGKRRLVKGKMGGYPQILVNGEIANIKTKLTDRADIEIVPGEVPPMQAPSLYDLVDVKRHVFFQGEKIELIRQIKINGHIVRHNNLLEQESYIELDEIRRLEDLAIEVEGEASTGDYLVNGKVQAPDYELLNGDIIKKPMRDSAKKDGKKSIKLVINNEETEIYYSKEKFIFVDIFDHIDFDLTTLKGKLVLEINGREAEYMEELREGDTIKVYWE
ncbi:MAG: cell division FtsA domain-containing protein [Tissierellaceae bacterium]